MFYQLGYRPPSIDLPVYLRDAFNKLDLDKASCSLRHFHLSPTRHQSVMRAPITPPQELRSAIAGTVADNYERRHENPEGLISLQA